MDTHNKLYLDVILDHDDELPLFIKKNKSLYKSIFLKFHNNFNSTGNNPLIIFQFVENCIELLTKLKLPEKDVIDNNFLDFFSDINFRTNTPSLILTLFRPDDNDELYLYYMSAIVKEHLAKPDFNKNVRYEPLKKLIEAFNYINHNYDIYLYDSNVIALIIAYCYLYDDNYSYLYTYMDNPDYCMDKIRNYGIEIDKNNKFDFFSETSMKIYDNINKLFIKDKIIIK